MPKTKQQPTISGAATSAKIHEFPLIEGFNRGYRNREDITTLPPGILVTGSQNVLTNTYQRVGVVKGYTLDGQRDTSGYPILSSYDWLRNTGDIQHLRAGFAVTEGDGKMQYRFVASAGDYYDGTTFTDGQVYWIDLMTGLGDVSSVSYLELSDSTDLVEESGGAGFIELANTGIADAATAEVRFRFAEFWDDVERLSLLLFVNSTSNIFMWSGGVTTLSSATVNTITKTGSRTWAEEGFLSSGTYTQEVVINGTVYTYTGGTGTITLTGVTPDPSGETLNSVIHQNVVTTANSAMTGIPATFTNYNIANISGQILVTATNSQQEYLSNVNTFTDYSFSTPRIKGEGAILLTAGVPTAIQVQEDTLYLSAGLDYWYQLVFKLSADNTTENVGFVNLKTTSRQGAISQEASSKIKNNLFYLSNEPVVNSLGTQQNYLLSPQTTDLSFPIVNDIDNYDLDDSSVFYHNKYGYVCVPKEGLMRVYNMTDDGKLNAASGTYIKNHYWEAPIGYPMKCLAVIDGSLYGHSYQSSNTYKLFDGYEFDGNVYECVAAFSFENHGSRNLRKNSTSAFTEGYITSNTTLTLTLQREVTGGSTAEFQILGSDTSIVQQPADVASLGKDSLGKHSLGGEDEFSNQLTNPPKFRCYSTYNPTPYFEEQTRYSSLGKNQVWELVSFGTNAKVATELPTDITK